MLRPGEALNGFRSNVLLPTDLLESISASARVYVSVDAPKTGKRTGALRQHGSMQGLFEVCFLCAWLNRMKPHDPLFTHGPRTFRKRWDDILSTLRVSAALEITPGGLRGGGAVYEYHHNPDIQQLMWRMRLSSAGTLQHYLQEVTSRQILIRVAGEGRTRIALAQSLYGCLLCRSALDLS